MNDAHGLERLESRELMAVGVTTAGRGTLVLTGNLAGDIVDVEGTGVAGQVDVFVNGGYIGTFSGVRNIRGNLGDGDDTLNLSSIDIRGNVEVFMGAGADVFDVDATPDTGVGPATRASIRGGVLVNLGGDAGDAVSISGGAGGVACGRSVALLGAAEIVLDGGGAQVAVEAADISIRGSLHVSLSGQGDVDGDDVEILLDNVNIGGVTTIIGSDEVDRILVSRSQFGRIIGALYDGNDVLDLDDGRLSDNRFFRSVLIDFGNGIDTVDDQPNNVYFVDPVGLNGPEILT